MNKNGEMKPITAPTTLQKIERRRNIINTKYYFTNRKVNPTLRNDVGVSCPFCIPKDNVIISYMKCTNKKNRVVPSRAISERLHIDDRPNNIRTVLDIHPEFYNVIEGRPIRPKENIKMYMENIRTYSMLQRQIGYRRDIVMRLRREEALETADYDRVTKEFWAHVKNFNNFVREIHNKATAKVQKCSIEEQKLTEKKLELLGYVESSITLKNKILNLDGKINVLSVYRKFLMYMSPESWRIKNDESYIPDVDEVFDSNAELAAVYNYDIESILVKAAEELKNPPSCVLYFQNPEELRDALRTKELQAREYLAKLNCTTEPMAQIKKMIMTLESEIENELMYFNHYTNLIQITIKVKQEREFKMRSKFFRILEGLFLETVASQEALRLQICLEYVFDKVFGYTPQSISEPARMIELLHEQLSEQLETLDLAKVQKVTKQLFKEDLKDMRLAHAARRERKVFDEMTAHLEKAFLPPKKFRRPKFEKIRNRISQDMRTRFDIPKTHVSQDSSAWMNAILSAMNKPSLDLFTECCEWLDRTPCMEEYDTNIRPILERR